MSDSEDLLSRIRLGEDTSLEFKEVRLSGTRVVGPGRDRLAVPGTSIADLDPSLRGRFVRSSTEPEEGVLRKMKILTEDDEGSVRASVGGVLLCTREPGAWLPGASIQAVRYRGSRPDANYQLDAREIRGPLDQQVNDAMAFVRRNMSVAARKGPGRIEFPQFSLRAVFEALVNAVAHRDYSVHGSRIRLFMFDDRLELFSPGSLPNTVTVDSLPLRQSTRNELVTSLLARCPVEGGEPGRTFMMEKRGEGVPIIIEETRRLAGMDPEYRVIDDAEVLLTIPAASPPDD